MSPFFVKAIQLLLSLSILIVLHELGHFIPAKLFKTRVEKFFLFFDVKFALFSKKIGETVYGIGWLPLGGYVKIAGMIDESMDKEQMAQPAQPWEFRSKPAWQRLIIMLGGVTVNVIVGCIIFICILLFAGQDIVTQEGLYQGFDITSEDVRALGFKDGDKILTVDGKELEDQTDINKLLFLRNIETVQVLHADGTTEAITIPEDLEMELFKKGVKQPFVPKAITSIQAIEPGSAAEKYGLKPGDSIIQINQVTVKGSEDMDLKIDAAREAQEDLTVTYIRDGYPNAFTIPAHEYKENVGFYRNVAASYTHLDYGVGESITEGLKYGWNTIADYGRQFKFVFTKEGATQVGGFGAIGNMFPATWDWLGFWQSTAIISMILAFMNVLPIPALDGGHVMFLIYEMITGKKPSDRFMEVSTMIGFFLLIALVLFANGNDLIRAIFGS